jgi:CheY-like chemotaxis protein
MKKLNCILLIEDNEFINIYNKKIIEKLDIADHVEVIDDAHEGLDYLLKTGKYKNQSQGHTPDLILLDINMPRMNGWEFIEEYRKLPKEKTDKIKIVILSTSPNPDDVKKISSIPGVLCFEKKPLTKEKIHHIIWKYFS